MQLNGRLAVMDALQNYLFTMSFGAPIEVLSELSCLEEYPSQSRASI